MFTTFVAMLVGMLFGTAIAGPLGGVLGIVVGIVGGMLLVGARDAVEEPGAEAVLVREEEQLLCVPKGQVATATFVRDARNGHWLDVARCSLCTPENEVGCAKRCLWLMRDTLPARKHPVRQSEPALVA